MKTICIYHSRDLDGWMSAAIVKKWNQRHNLGIGKSDRFKDDNLDFLGWDYGDGIPDLTNYDEIIMCDVSFVINGNDATPMLDIQKSGKAFMWLDHHKSAIEEVYSLFDKEGVADPAGIRDEKFAACELTWQYFFPNDKMPEIVRLLGRYDCFGHKGTDEEQKVLEFQYAARAHMSDYSDCYLSLNASTENANKDIKMLLEHGKVIYFIRIISYP